MGQYVSVTTIAGLSAGRELGAVAGESDPPAARTASVRHAFVECADAVYRFIYVRVGGDRETTEEILQECCRCAAARRRPPADPTAWPGWFCGIARNLIRRHWRRRRRDQRGHAAFCIARDVLPEDALLAGEELGELMSALTKMSLKDQDLLFAFYFDGRSCAAIAAENRFTLKAVEARLRRARERLRAALQPREGSP